MGYGHLPAELRFFCGSEFIRESSAQALHLPCLKYRFRE
jgi:hypothetical protein